MPMVEEYWSGVLRRMQAEVEVFNELIEHAGEKGRANELTLSQVISRLVPQRYAVGSGILIDSHDNHSSQTDIVIYNQGDEPAVLAQSTQVLFPVENVRLCIEVKTSVGKEEIYDASAKRRTVENLRPATGRFPAYALVGFTGELGVDKAAEHLTEIDTLLDVAVVLQDGLIGGWHRLLCPINDAVAEASYLVGLTCIDSATQDALLTGLGNDRKAKFARFVEHHGVLYPIVKRAPGKRLISDPARALLLFCDAVLRILAEHDVHGSPTLSHYITDQGREILTLKQKVI